MARIPMVTRTIKTTKVNVLGLDTETREPFNTEVVLPRTYKNDDAMLKVIRPLVENDHIKVVSIVSSEVSESLYGLTEQEFINVAHELPPR